MIDLIGNLDGVSRLVLAGFLLVLGCWFIGYAIRDLLKAIKEGQANHEKE